MNFMAPIWPIRAGFAIRAGKGGASVELDHPGLVPAGANEPRQVRRGNAHGRGIDQRMVVSDPETWVTERT
jgi:hypothetical protein